MKLLIIVIVTVLQMENSAGRLAIVKTARTTLNLKRREHLL